MNNGAVNIFTSRRTNFLDCEYWLVEKNDLTKDKSLLTHENTPEGTFSAKIENVIENSSSVVAQTFIFDSNTLSISTTDFIPGLKRNCLVKINQLEGIWRVDNINQSPIRNNYQFDSELTFKTYIQLRR